MEKRGNYTSLLKSGELKRRTETSLAMLRECSLCPHDCRVDRTKGEKGFCGVARQAIIASYGPHFGEEPPLSGNRGSGTVFFSGCNMSCIFCQNYEISHAKEGYEVSKEFLAFAFLSLQEEGCHNINLVSPSHVVPQILEALLVAASEGLSIPIVYNCGGYDKVTTLKLLDGIIDIYMPDMKYSDDKIALKLSKIKRYWQVSKQAVKEMHRQIGLLTLNKYGVAVKGLLIRHLVLPEDLSGTKKICKFIAQEISPETRINIMDQYRPCGEAFRYPPLDRRISNREYQQALQWAAEAGLKGVM